MTGECKQRGREVGWHHYLDMAEPVIGQRCQPVSRFTVSWEIFCLAAEWDWGCFTGCRDAFCCTDYSVIDSKGMNMHWGCSVCGMDTPSSVPPPTCDTFMYQFLISTWIHYRGYGLLKFIYDPPCEQLAPQNWPHVCKQFFIYKLQWARTKSHSVANFKSNKLR